MHARLFRDAAIHDRFLEALQRGVDTFTRLDLNLNQAPYHLVSVQIVPEDYPILYTRAPGKDTRFHETMETLQTAVAGILGETISAAELSGRLTI